MKMGLMASMVAKVVEMNALEKYDAQMAALETYNIASKKVHADLGIKYDMLPGVLTAGFVGCNPEDRHPPGVPATEAIVGHW